MPAAEEQADFERIAVIGPGLLGGSIAKAIPARLPAADLRVWGRREEPLEALRLGAAKLPIRTKIVRRIEGI